MTLDPQFVCSIQEQLKDIPLIGVCYGRRHHTFTNEPQTMNWQALCRQLAEGWTLDELTAKQLPETASLRMDSKERLAERKRKESAEHQKATRQAKEVADYRKTLAARPAVWYAIPCADPQKGTNCLQLWRAVGYRTAVLLDAGTPPIDADVVYQEDEYRGYPASVNKLCRMLLPLGAEIIVTGGDDIYPDPQAEPDAILAEFKKHFGGTFGVMQPIGDDYPGTDRICGSPWMGREFVERINQGTGPFWHEYEHFFCDEEMFEICKLEGLLWQRDDLTQYHDHWGRRGERAPAHTAKHHSKGQWSKYKKLLKTRKEASFPGHEPLSHAS